jgi:cytochrome P450
MLSNLLEAQKEKLNEMMETAVISMTIGNISTGSDTTAISLRAVLYHLLKSSTCKQSIIKEIKETKEMKRKEALGNTISLEQAE